MGEDIIVHPAQVHTRHRRKQRHRHDQDDRQRQHQAFKLCGQHKEDEYTTAMPKTMAATLPAAFCSNAMPVHSALNPAGRFLAITSIVPIDWPVE